MDYQTTIIKINAQAHIQAHEFFLNIHMFYVVGNNEMTLGRAGSVSLECQARAIYNLPYSFNCPLQSKVAVTVRHSHNCGAYIGFRPI